MNYSVFKKIMTITCFAVVLIALTACGGNQTPTTPAISEPAVTATPTPVQDVSTTPQQTSELETADPEEADEQSNQGMLTIEQAQNLVQEAFANYGIINHNAEYDFWEGDVLHFFFEVSYSAFSGITDVVWVDTITGELEMISGVEFLHGDDWFEDYDPYWMYRDGGLDPFGDDDWIEAGTATSGEGGDGRLVCRWESSTTFQILQFHSNGMYELWDDDGNLICQGSWMAFVANTVTGERETLAFWNRVDVNDPNSVWQPYQGTMPDGNGGRTRVWISNLTSRQYRVIDENRALIHTPHLLTQRSSTWGEEWNRIQ